MISILFDLLRAPNRAATERAGVQSVNKKMPQSFIINQLLLLLLILIVFVHPRVLPFDNPVDNCFYSLRIRGALPNGMFKKMTDWDVTDVEEGSMYDEKDCPGTFDGCATYSCIDGDDNQLFVINSCAPNGGGCNEYDLRPFCADMKGTPKCQICGTGQCNRLKIEMQPLKPKPVPEIQIPLIPDEDGAAVVAHCPRFLLFCLLLFSGSF
uniref:Chitin-binding type-2 domain-containing protein n=1 Tax=Globodera pallida TaxID=36090 RepID=A0A183BZR4_GLOPA